MERVIRIKKGKYTVRNDADEERECFAKGSLKIKSDGILTGDFVKTENDVIVGVLPRKNRLERPFVANVDAVAIVVADPPSPDFYLLDKLLASCFLSGVEAVIVVNKTDLSDENLKKITEQYSAVAKIFRLSALTVVLRLHLFAYCGICRNWLLISLIVAGMILVFQTSIIFLGLLQVHGSKDHIIVCIIRLTCQMRFYVKQLMINLPHEVVQSK